MKRHAASSRRTRAGFTLLELLVVMSLLSIIMVGLTSALRTMAQTEAKIDHRLEQLDDDRILRAFLQKTLSRVSAYKVPAPGATGKTVVQFAITPDSLSWVGIMPARAHLGGRYHFRLGLEAIGDQTALVLRFAPWSPHHVQPDWSGTENRILRTGVEQFQIETQGIAPANLAPLAPWPKGWQAGWPTADALPDQLRLHWTDAHGNGPDWVFALRTLPRADSSLNLVTVGGGS